MSSQCFSATVTFTLLITIFFFTIRKLANINSNIHIIFSSIYDGDIYQLNFWYEYSHGIYWGNRSRKRKNKKSQTVRWRVSFTNNVIDRINPTIKFVCEYAIRKLSSVYTDDIIEGITMRFKKTNRMVIWYFYWQNCRQSYYIGLNKIILNIIIPFIMYLYDRFSLQVYCAWLDEYTMD